MRYADRKKRSDSFEFKTERTCANCKETKPVAEFHAYAYTTTGGNRGMRYKSDCKKCTTVIRSRRHYSNRDAFLRKQRQYRATNREHCILRDRKWRDKNIERVRRSKQISQSLRHSRTKMPAGENRLMLDAVFEDYRVGDKYIDAYSGELIDNPTIDHVVPVSRGGKHEFDNLCLTSFSNNTRKSNKPLLIYMLEQVS